MFEALKKVVPGRWKHWLRVRLNAQEVDLPASPRAFIFLAADYGNIGDLAITFAQRQFILQIAPQYEVVTIPISATSEMIQSIRRQITPNDLITTIGGGNMGSLYPDIEDLRQLVIRSFPNNRVVSFPQTLDWEDAKTSSRAVERLRRTYSGHPDLHLFARETVSLVRLRELFSACDTVKVDLVPDIVLNATAEQLGAKGPVAPCGALLCLRNDEERSLGSDSPRILRQALAAAGLSVLDTDTHVGGVRMTSERCAHLLADKLNQFQAAELVVTDRLHGMILSVLAGTPCIVLPNSNHKIRQTWWDWLQTEPLVKFVELDQLDNLSEVLEELLSLDRPPAAVRRMPMALYTKLSDSFAMPCQA